MTSVIFPQVGQEVMSITIHSLALEPGCSLLTRRDVQGYFMEFQLLDYDYAELETPSVVVPPPPSSLSLHFNFRKGACTYIFLYCAHVCIMHGALCSVILYGKTCL